MSRSRFIRATTLTLALLAVTGCGGGSTASAGSPPFGSAAKAMPAHALVFVDVNLDHSSPAWKNALAIGSRFPGWKAFVTKFQTQINTSSSGDGSFATKVEPWLGNEAGVAVTGVNVADSAHPVGFVGYVAVKDDGKAKSALATGKHTAAMGAYKEFSVYRSTSASQVFAALGPGALLISNSTATLHAAVDSWDGDAPRLASDQAFQTAIAALPNDSLMTAYADGAQLGQLLSLASLSSMSGSSTATAAQIAKLAAALHGAGAITASLGADSGGVRLTVNSSARTAGTAASTDGPPPLFSDVPAQAFAYFGFRGSGGFAGTPYGAQTQSTLRAFTQLTGLSVKRDIAPLFTGAGAFYAAPGLPLSVAALLQPKQPEAATAAMYRITAAIERLQPNLHFRTVGHTGQVVRVGGVQVGWHRIGDVIAVSNDPTAGAAQSPGLGSSSGYASVASQAGVPPTVSFLAYVGLPQLLNALPVAAPTDPNVGHVGGLVMWSSSDGTGFHFVTYLQVK